MVKRRASHRISVWTLIFAAIHGRGGACSSRIAMQKDDHMNIWSGMMTKVPYA